MLNGRCHIPNVILTLHELKHIYHLNLLFFRELLNMYYYNCFENNEKYFFVLVSLKLFVVLAFAYTYVYGKSTVCFQCHSVCFVKV